MVSDIQYEDLEVCEAQIPVLHIDLPETRSLNDPCSHVQCNVSFKNFLLYMLGCLF